MQKKQSKQKESLSGKDSFERSEQSPDQIKNPQNNEKISKYQNDPKQENKSALESSQNEQQRRKKVIILMPMTIPATGKSTMVKTIQDELEEYHVEFISCDDIRAKKMERVMQKDQNLTKLEAEKIVNPAANKKYYKQLFEKLKGIEQNQSYDDSIIFLDRNHSQMVIKKAIQEIKIDAKRIEGIDVKVVCIIPKCDDAMTEKGKYHYPFSECYIASCLKRVIDRDHHATLQGSEIQRANVCISFANNFRNFPFSNKNLLKYFDSAIRFPFHNEQKVPIEVSKVMKKILLGKKPGDYEIHPKMQELIEALRNWEHGQISVQIDTKGIRKTINELFSNFENLEVDVNHFPGEGESEDQQQYEYGDDYIQENSSNEQKQENVPIEQNSPVKIII